MNPRYEYDPTTGPWEWRLAEAEDIDDIADLCEQHYQPYMQEIITPDRTWFKYQVALAITHQHHHRAHQMFLVCRLHATDELIAYAWMTRGAKPVWTQEEQAEARLAHVLPTLSPKHRIALIAQMLAMWETWARVCKIPVIVSTSILPEQRAFMRLHEQQGYTVLGSYAYKRLKEK